MRNRGIGRGRMFVGGFLLFGAVIAWATGLMLSPHGPEVAEGTEHVRVVIVTFIRNVALATILLAALSAFLLFPKRRPPWPQRDWALGGLIALLIAASLYQLYWLKTSVAPQADQSVSALERM